MCPDIRYNPTFLEPIKYSRYLIRKTMNENIEITLRVTQLELHKLDNYPEDDSQFQRNYAHLMHY